MSAANHESAEGEPARVGLVADSDELAWLAPAIACCPLRLVAQAGMRQAEALPEVAWFDDTRVMIAQSGIVGLLLATSVRAGVQLGRTASEHGLHVWRLPPVGRSFAEAAEVVRSAAQGAVVYRVASWWQQVAGQVGEALRQVENLRLRLSDVRVALAGPAVRSWRASRVDAGGGVLATGAYDMLEALVALRRLPQSVSAAIGGYRRRAGQAPRETEDAALAILRYEGGGLAAVQATWDATPGQEVSAHHGAEATLVLSRQSVALVTPAGRVLHQRPLPGDTRSRELAGFAAAIRSGRKSGGRDAVLERHLAVAALLEAIYLAARTGQPEVPAKLYEVEGWPLPQH